MVRSRASSARENSASYGGRLGCAMTRRLDPSGVTYPLVHRRLGALAAERFLRQLEQPGGICRTRSATFEDGSVSSSRLLATAALSPSGRSRSSASSSVRSSSNSSWRSASQPTSRDSIGHARVHAIDFGSRAQLIDPCVDAIAVIRDRISVRSGEDDVQLIEAAERARETCGTPESRDHREGAA